MKKMLALLLTLCMLAMLFAGCGSAAASTASEAASAAEASEAAAPDAPAAPEAPEADDAAPAEEASAVEEASAEEEAEPELELAEPLSYPIADGTETLEMLNVYNPNASAVYGGTGDYSSAYTYATLAEATGVNVTFHMLAEATYSTQIDLIIASGDTPDIYGRSLGSYDSKLLSAIEDDVVVDILPLVEEHAPDLYNLMQKDPDWKTKLENEDGSICKIAGYSLNVTCDGPFIRGDWLDELGLSAPTNLDELTEVLSAFQSEYGCKLTLLLDADLGSVLDQCFNFTAMGFKSFSFQQDSPDSANLICSLCSEEYIDYLLTLNEYYEKGIINSDFLNTSKDAGNLEACYIEGNSGIWKDDAKYTYNNAAAAKEADPDWRAEPFTFDKTDYHMNQSSSGGGVSMCQCYIAAGSENIELALEFLNYGYTEEGMKLIQLGEEGVTYEYGEGGKLQYTDVIINNPDGWTSSQASYVYLTDAWMPTIQMAEVFEMAYSEETIEAYNTFTDAYGGDDAMTIPRECRLNSDEQSEVYSLFSDCLTLFSENAGKVILGDLDEAGYRDVIEQANEQGLTRITEIYQNAYDEYLAGER